MKTKVAVIATAVIFALSGCGGGGSSSSNTPPTQEPQQSLTISSSAVTQATEDTQYRYQLTTNTAEIVTYSIVGSPPGMILSPSGLLTWTPEEGQLTSGEVTVTALSGENEATQKFTISVTPVNDSPQVGTIQAQSIESGESLSLQLVVQDPDDENNGTDIQFFVQSAPPGLTVSPTGLISYTSSASSSTDNRIVIRIEDGLEDSAQAAIVEFDLEELFYLSFSGQTTDYYTNDTIAGSITTVAQSGNILQTITSDATGNFSTKLLDRDVNVSQSLIFTSDATGYTEASERLTLDEARNGINLYLPAVHGSSSFSSNTATTLQVNGESIVQLTENSFSDASGTPYTGNVNAEMFVIDPSMDIDLMPGEMVTVDSNNNEVPIESFGAITVTFTDDDSNPLQLSANKTADIRIPASGTNPPATIPLYHYDNVAGVWVEEGSATLENGFYVGQVSHFTTWNADKIYETIIVNGCVVDKDGNSISNARITSEGIDYNGRSSDYSDSNGLFSLPVRQNSELIIAAESNYQSRSLTVNTNAEDMTIQECLVLDDAITKIKLTWGENPRDLDSHLYGPKADGSRFHVYYSADTHTVNGETIYLDVDDTSSYGPEIITIPSFSVPGVYKYSVYNYSGTPDIVANQTVVEAIIDGNRTVYTPPSGTPQRWWHILHIDVADDLSFIVTPINEWSNQNPDEAAPSRPTRSQILQPKASIPQQMLDNKYYAK
jgi:hypothetical protein